MPCFSIQLPSSMSSTNSCSMSKSISNIVSPFQNIYWAALKDKSCWRNSSNIMPSSLDQTFSCKSVTVLDCITLALSAMNMPVVNMNCSLLDIHFMIIYIYIHTHVCVCLCVCIYMCVYGFVCVCVCVCVCDHNPTKTVFHRFSFDARLKRSNLNNKVISCPICNWIIISWYLYSYWISLFNHPNS